MSAATATKIERVTEATESLVLATVVAVTEVNAPSARQNVFDARQEYRDALDELLKPTLRVVANDRLG